MRPGLSIEVPSPALPPELVTPLSVELLDPGTEPRSTLRYQLGASMNTFTITREGHYSERMGRNPRLDIDLPAHRHSFYVQQLAGEPLVLVVPGTSERLEGAGRVGEVIAALEAQRDALLGGRVCGVEFDARGILGDIDIAAHARPWSARRELASLLASHVVVLPVEPVGVGARWRVRMAVPTAGGYAKQTTEYRLVERRGARLELEADGKRSAERQPVPAVELGAGSSAEIIALTMTYRGRTTISLDHILPAASSLTLSQTFHGRTAGSDGAVIDYTNAFDGQLEVRRVRP